jgi:hypothetical protein
MLGDGSLSLSRSNKGKAKYSMTMDVYSLDYFLKNHLDQTIYSQITDKKFMLIQINHFLNIEGKK